MGNCGHWCCLSMPTNSSLEPRMVMTDTVSPAERARSLACQGFPVFPLRGKKPLLGSCGFKDASGDLHAIERMPWHLANAVGIACGGDDARLLVLDFDADKSGTTPLLQSLAVARLRSLPLTFHTRRVKTPGGGNGEELNAAKTCQAAPSKARCYNPPSACSISADFYCHDQISRLVRQRSLQPILLDVTACPN